MPDSKRTAAKPAPIEDKSKRRDSLACITVDIAPDTFKDATDTTDAHKRKK